MEKNIKPLCDTFIKNKQKHEGVSTEKRHFYNSVQTQNKGGH